MAPKTRPELGPARELYLVSRSTNGVCSESAVDRIEPIIESHWRTIWRFAARVSLDARRASEIVEETFLRAFIGAEKMPTGSQVERWLLRIASHLTEKKAGGQDVSFEMLDEVLRSEATRTETVASLSEPEKNFLLWELKQGCMTAVINCLPPGERVAFVLSVIIGISENGGAQTLGITPSAYKVRLSRARKKVADYLAPRCEHVDPANPCRCPSRLGIALAKGFVKTQHGEVQIRPSFGRYGSGKNAPLRDVMAIYGSLPETEPPEALLPHLLELAGSAKWQEIKARAGKGKG